MYQPFFSIILPTYNRASLVGIAIESVLKQTFDDFELIIVDDGSTDNTYEVVSSFHDDRIRYFKKENEERNIARNFGIKRAKGEYIGFLDSDDIIYSDHLEHANAFLIEKKFPEIIHLNFEIIGSSVISSEISKRNITDANQELINGNILSCNSIFVKNEIIRQFQFLNSQNIILGEDHYLWLKLAARYKIHLSKKVTNAMIEHGERSLNNIDIKRLKIGINEVHAELNTDVAFLNFYGWKAKKYFAFNYIFIALQLVIQNRRHEAISYLKFALLEYPFSFLSRRFLAVLKNMLLLK